MLGSIVGILKERKQNTDDQIDAATMFALCFGTYKESFWLVFFFYLQTSTLFRAVGTFSVSFGKYSWEFSVLQIEQCLEYLGIRSNTYFVFYAQLHNLIRKYVVEVNILYKGYGLYQ